jgi:hypothetical protein
VRPDPGSQAEKLPAELIHRNRSLIVTPSGSRILTCPVKVADGRVKTNTWPVVSGVADGSDSNVPVQGALEKPPPVKLQLPDSVKFIVNKNARAGDGAKASPTTVNAAAVSAIRFMIITLNRPPQSRRSRRAAVDVAVTPVNFVRHDPPARYPGG